MIKLSKEAALSLGHNYVGTEHLLLGLLKEGTSVAAKVLNENGVDYDKVVGLIKELIAPADGVQVLENGGYSPRMEKLLENNKR